jgi:hypothetical protein
MLLLERPTLVLATRLLVCGLLCVSILLNARWAFRSDSSLHDYASFLVSGKAYDLGLNPYGIYENELAPHAKVFRAGVGDWEADSVNLNPPISVHAFRLLTHFDGPIGKAVVSIGSLVLFGLLMGILLREYPGHFNLLTVVALFNLAGLWHVVELGQIYLLLLAALTGAWFALQRGHFTLAGLLIGLVVAIKPPFLILPALLFVSGHRRPSVVAVVLAAGLSSLPLLLDGFTIYEQWLSASRDISGDLVTGPGNSSLAGLSSRVADPILGMAAAVVLLGATLALCHRYRPDVRTCYALGVLAVLFVGPLTWAGYGLFLLPWLLARPWRAWEWTSIAILSVPVWLLLDAYPTDALRLLTASIYSAAFVIVAVLLLRDAGFARNWTAPATRVPTTAGAR